MKIKNTRLPYYDYSNDGYYFITIVSHLRQPLLLTHHAQIENALASLGRENVLVDFHVLMPDHIHMLLVLEDSKFSLSEIIRRFKARASKAACARLWQPNYYEHVIRNEKALEKIREYIQNNPDAMEMQIDGIYNTEIRPMNRAATKTISSLT